MHVEKLIDMDAKEKLNLQLLHNFSRFHKSDSGNNNIRLPKIHLKRLSKINCPGMLLRHSIRFKSFYMKIKVQVNSLLLTVKHDLD